MLTGALLALAVIACAPAGHAVAESSTPDRLLGRATFRVGVVEYVDNLNPFIGFSGLDYLVYHLSYDFLVGWDPVKLRPRPEFAESWTHSADGRTWTFKIRPGMIWQDGQPATARDVAFTFNYIVENDLSAYTPYTTSIEKVRALDGLTVRFLCSKPKADILYMPVPILPEHVWSKVPPEAATISFANGPPTIGSGPFQVVENRRNHFVRLAANKHYWRGGPHIDDLLFITYRDPDTMVKDLVSGLLDAAFDVPPALLAGLGSKDITTNAGTSWMSTQLSFNCYESPDSLGNPVLRDQRFRQALQYAVDRDTIAEVAFGGYLTVGSTLLPPYSEYHWEPPSAEEYTFDLGKAEALLDAAGYTDVDGDTWRETKQGKPLTLRLYTPADRPSLVAAAKLVTGWLGAVGIRVHLEALDGGALVARITNREGSVFAPDFDMSLGLWQGDSQPQFILSLLTPAQIGGWSDTSWTQPDYTKLFGQESTELVMQSRIAAVERLQQIVHRASPYLIFGYPQRLEAYNSSKWRGYVPAPSGFPGYRGSVLSFPDQIDSYTELRLAGETAAVRTGPSSWVYAASAGAVAATLAVVVLMHRRRKVEVETR